MPSGDQDEKRRDEFQNQTTVKRVPFHGRGQQRPGRSARPESPTPATTAAPATRRRAQQAATGRTTPAQGQIGATRLSGVTKISSKIPAAAASRGPVQRQRPDRQESEIPEQIHRRVRAEQAGGGPIRHEQAHEPADPDRGPDRRIAQPPRTQALDDQRRRRQPRRRRPRQTSTRERPGRDRIASTRAGSTAGLPTASSAARLIASPIARSVEYGFSSLE